MENTEPFLLKNIFSEVFLQQVATEIHASYPDFDKKHFLLLVFGAQWPDMELKERMRHISHCLRDVLPNDYRTALGILTQTVERMIKEGERMTFEWCILPDFVEAHGADDPDASLPALEILTRLSSAEFAIRPFLLRYPDRAMAQMQAWAQHSSPLVRRLSSEGFRPRLPWGMGVPYLKKDPSPILPVLETLKDDPAETVRRSVANNLNDISKEHPELALSIAQHWLGHSPETDWVVRHACRGLLKKGNAQALALFGFEQGAPNFGITAVRADASVAIGGMFHFSFTATNHAAHPQKIRLEYAIDYQNASGKGSRKVFQIKEMVFEPGALEQIARRQSFKDFTTRKHFAGPHRLAILVNGAEMASVDFSVKL
jgi:3-methyladenine DNA glycosylase AlkC